ncbi:MAG: hypothetical protein PHN39_00200 [Candidatus Pacebacteria bacterium]|nr:hypothetical protein [Candidatus Paceibacterota bacterium]
MDNKPPATGEKITAFLFFVISSCVILLFLYYSVKPLLPPKQPTIIVEVVEVTITPVPRDVFRDSITLKNEISRVFDGLYDGDCGSYMGYLIVNGFKQNLLTKQETFEYIQKLENQSSIRESWWITKEVKELQKSLDSTSRDFSILNN